MIEKITDNVSEIYEIIKYIGYCIAAITIWYKDLILAKLGIKKEENEVEKTSLNNLQQNMDLYQELVDDLDARYKTRIERLQAEFDESFGRLQSELNNLKEVNNQLNTLIEKQKKTIQKYVDKYGELV
ncbi:hypothetical protein ACFSKN_04725 [Mariniflexile gromovii]|uniref:Uncharacterized protein n=1 Tax=Mariniflexile gromovii TaxID=362523 RepID=A0ABS4BW83_9FLAO|nr:hypothetical protein [Mariniflexile gromovii]MBP0904848.1 hypothetical protein [Mariniflexile gromovii]